MEFFHVITAAGIEAIKLHIGQRWFWATMFTVTYFSVRCTPTLIVAIMEQALAEQFMISAQQRIAGCAIGAPIVQIANGVIVFISALLREIILIIRVLVNPKVYTTVILYMATPAFDRIIDVATALVLAL